MKEQIDRLGFVAWADNKIVNFIEDHGQMFNDSPEGYLCIEGDNYSVTSTHKGEYINIVVRAYVTDEGWKSHEWSVRRWKGVRS